MFDKRNVGVRILDLRNIMPGPIRPAADYDYHRQAIVAIVHNSPWRKAHKEQLILLGQELLTRWGGNADALEQTLRKNVYGTRGRNDTEEHLKLVVRTGAYVRVAEYDTNSPLMNLTADGRGGWSVYYTLPKTRFILKEVE